MPTLTTSADSLLQGPASATTSADAILQPGPLLQAIIDLTAAVVVLQADADAIQAAVITNAVGADIAADVANVKSDTKKPNPLGTNIKPWK